MSAPVAQGQGVWSLAWPSMTLFGLHALTGIVDFVFVSSLGSEALAAVGVANQIHFLFFSLLAAVNAGTVAVVAREWGRGDRAAAARATQCSLALAGAFCAAMLLAIPFARELVASLGVAPGVAALGGSVLGVLLLWMVPFGLEVTLTQALRGAGDVRTPLYVGVGANVINVVADWMLIFGNWGAPELGAVGSAWASGIAFGLSALVLFGLWLRNLLLLPRGRWRGSVTRHEARRLLRIGIPTALEQCAFQGGLLLFMGVVATFGTPSISAYLIGVRLLSLCFVPGFGFALAAATLVGQHLGAEQPEEAERAGWRGMRGAVAVMGGVGLSIVLAAGPLASLFGAAGDETLTLSISFIYILGAAQPFMAIEFALSGALRGAGDTRFPLYVILIGLFVVRLGSALLVAKPLFGSITAVWLCLVADYAIKSALLARRFAAGRWKEIVV